MSFQDIESFIRPFPGAEEVFSGRIDAHRKVLQPLLSVDASKVDPAWGGWLHFVMPIEPDDGLIGEDEDSEPYHTDYCVTNWVAFEVRDSKYRFLADFRYFRINSDKIRPENRDYLQSDYDEKEASLAETKRVFAATGELRAPMNPAVRVAWLNDLGGETGAANWTAFGLKILAGRNEEGDFVRPCTKDGRAFRYVGSLTGWNYRPNAPDSILLFYDPETSVAALTFDYT
jgi:NADH:ubiquinone oxidoreductase subunit